MLYEVYVDESGSDGGSPVLCVSGYLFHPEQSVQFQSEWRQLLAKYRLPYFHMVDCAHDPGNPPFDHLTKSQRTEAAKEAIQIIKRRTEIGWSVAVREEDFNLIIKTVSPRSTAYYLCLSMITDGVRLWCEASNFDGQIAYFFESGHRDHSVSDVAMTDVFRDEHMRRRYRYFSHRFNDKKAILGLQAADILAWQSYKYEKDYVLSDARPPRKDFQELVRPQDLIMELSPMRLAVLYARRFPHRIESPLTFALALEAARRRSS